VQGRVGLSEPTHYNASIAAFQRQNQTSPEMQSQSVMMALARHCTVVGVKGRNGEDIANWKIA
jgi:hypothetical protein